MASQTSFPEDLHYVPHAEWTSRAFTVLRAGKVVAGPGYGIRRAQHAGQDILFCMSGCGVVEIGTQRIDVRPGELVWIPNESPHAHWADDLQPWTLLWFRFDGPDPASMRAKVFGDAQPHAVIDDTAALVAWFERLFAALRKRTRSLDLQLNKLMSDVFVMLDAAQTQGRPASGLDPLTQAMAIMRADIGRSWSTDDLADLLQLSASQTRRLFQRHLQVNPKRWLMRERLIAAQTLMMQSETSLATVAATCGFCDVYHFGREFKRVVGISPAAWRRAELGSANAPARGDVA